MRVLSTTITPPPADGLYAAEATGYRAEFLAPNAETGVVKPYAHINPDFGVKGINIPCSIRVENGIVHDPVFSCSRVPADGVYEARASGYTSAFKALDLISGAIVEFQHEAKMGWRGINIRCTVTVINGISQDPVQTRS